MTTVVYPYGPQPAPLLIVGEAPGAVEARLGRPFAGPSGEEQRGYLARHGVAVAQARLANVVWEWREGNPDPTAAQLREWGPRLEAEVRATQPKVIAAVGRYAMRWFLGEGATLDACRGVAHEGGAFDKTRAGRACGAVVVPVVHPAAALHNDASDVRAHIADGYRAVAVAIGEAQRGGRVEVTRDEWLGREEYRDVGGCELGDMLRAARERGELGVVALDTEGYARAPWSLQVAWRAGHGYLLRAAREDARAAIDELQRVVDGGALVVGHNLVMHDFAVARALGLELQDARVWDTMYAAYLMRLEPLGMKALAWRWCGMAGKAWREVVGGMAEARQLDYLYRVAETRWPKPEARLRYGNDGSVRMYRPQAVAKVVERIVKDYHLAKGSSNTDGDASDDDGGDARDSMLWRRWRGVDRVQRAMVETRRHYEMVKDYDHLIQATRSAHASDTGKVAVEGDAGNAHDEVSLDMIEGVLAGLTIGSFGSMPQPTLDDVALDAAVDYAARDPDMALRLYLRLSRELESRGLATLMAQSMEELPAIEQMQATGMPVARERVVALAARMEAAMREGQSRISHKWWGGQPFNPKSTRQVNLLLVTRGLRGAKLTKRGAMSTGKQSIEHLRYKDEAVEAVMAWREAAHLKSMFCDSLLATLGEDEVGAVQCRLKVTGTTTRRLASKEPNLLAFPKHEKPGRQDYGTMIRDCFVCGAGEMLVESDLSQIESRVLAHESQDELLCGLFGEGRDIHAETAARIFGVGLNEVSKLQRTLAKRTNFGIPYGLQDEGLAVQLRTMGIEGWDRERCGEFRREWLKLYRGVARYLREAEEDAGRRGEVADCWGMPRYLPGVWSRDRKVAAEARRQAVNHRIQGGAQGMLRRGVAWLYREVRAMQRAGVQVRLCLTVHDSVLLRVEDGVADAVGALAVEALTEHCGMELRVPVEASATKARSWGEL